MTDLNRVARAAWTIANDIDQSGVNEHQYYLADQFRKFAIMLDPCVDPSLYDPYDD